MAIVDTFKQSPMYQRGIQVVGLLVLGTIGGFIAQAIGLPMPFLFGALLTVGGWSIFISMRMTQSAPYFPRPVRKLCIAVLGTMIGFTFTPEVLEVARYLWVSALALVVFIPLVLALGYCILRYIGRYDHVDALFCAMPGGLIESIVFGERAGANVQLLTIHQFGRLVVVICSVPLLFYMVTGEIVGSAAGERFSLQESGWYDLVIIAIVAIIGLWIGKICRLPAGQLTGPIVLSAVLSGSGLLSVASPPWLLAGAQLIMGISLGVQFFGLQIMHMLRALLFSVVVIAVVLAVGYGFAVMLEPLMPLDIATLFISFAPGGVSEMGLIALSVHSSPVVVIAHHILRILLCIIIIQLVGRK